MRVARAGLRKAYAERGLGASRAQDRRGPPSDAEPRTSRGPEAGAHRVL